MKISMTITKNLVHIPLNATKDSYTSRCHSISTCTFCITFSCHLPCSIAFENNFEKELVWNSLQCYFHPSIQSHKIGSAELSLGTFRTILRDVSEIKMKIINFYFPFQSAIDPSQISVRWQKPNAHNLHFFKFCNQINCSKACFLKATIVYIVYDYNRQRS